MAAMQGFLYGVGFVFGVAAALLLWFIVLAWIEDSSIVTRWIRERFNRLAVVAMICIAVAVVMGLGYGMSNTARIVKLAADSAVASTAPQIRDETQVALDERLDKIEKKLLETERAVERAK